MKTRRNTLLLSAMLWLSIFLVDTLTACTAVHETVVPETRVIAETLPAERDTMDIWEPVIMEAGEQEIFAAVEPIN